jgi:hypothetical protein
VVVVADWTDLGAAAANSSPNVDSNWRAVILGFLGPLCRLCVFVCRAVIINGFTMIQSQ